MKNYNYLVCLLICFFCFSCVQKQKEQAEELNAPKVLCTFANVSGKIQSPHQELNSIVLKYVNPISGDESLYETNLGADGSFSFNVPIELSCVVASLYLPCCGGTYILLSPDVDAKVECKMNNSAMMEVVNVDDLNIFNVNEKKKGFMDAWGRFMTKIKDDSGVYEMTPKEFAAWELEVLEKRIENSFTGIKFSEAGKVFVRNELNLLGLKGRLLAYKEAMELSYMHTHDLHNFLDLDGYTPQEPEIDYYYFLEKFDLSNPQYLYNTYFINVVQSLFEAKAFNISPIEDTPVDEWLKKVKSTMAVSLGFDSGLFYDVFAANAYSKQLNDESKPLSDTQKKNIQTYFGESEIAKILFRKNEALVKSLDGQAELVKNDTPNVPNVRLMNAILSKYKGKTVVVDFWATWCGPCLEAMQKIEPLKSELKNENVVFVYITNRTSPQNRWEIMAKKIGGEHYYLAVDGQWNYIAEEIGFQGIPAYSIYNAKGEFCEKFIGYPGTNEMRDVIMKHTQK